MSNPPKIPVSTWERVGNEKMGDVYFDLSFATHVAHERIKEVLDARGFTPPPEEEPRWAGETDVSVAARIIVKEMLGSIWTQKTGTPQKALARDLWLISRLLARPDHSPTALARDLKRESGKAQEEGSVVKEIGRALQKTRAYQAETNTALVIVGERDRIVHTFEGVAYIFSPHGPPRFSGSIDLAC